MDLNNMVEKYFLPKELSIDMEYTYRGVPIDQSYFIAHSEILSLYPSNEEILNLRSAILKNWKEGDRFVIHVSEEGARLIRK